MRSRVLFISGHAENARELMRMLLDLPLALHHAKSLCDARHKVRQYTYTVLLTDSVLSDGTWLDVLGLARESSSELRVIVTDPHADARFWAEALNLGAYDLLVQPFYPQEVRRILSNACSRMPAREVTMAAI
jgi:DNA-binding NtrC family response regulator